MLCLWCCCCCQFQILPTSVSVGTHIKDLRPFWFLISFIFPDDNSGDNGSLTKTALVFGSSALYVVKRMAQLILGDCLCPWVYKIHTSVFLFSAIFSEWPFIKLYAKFNQPQEGTQFGGSSSQVTFLHRNPSLASL